MNVLVMDSQGILSLQQSNNVRERLIFALTRFSHRINGVTVHFERGNIRDKVSCTVNISLEGFGIVTARRTNDSLPELFNSVIDLVESKVAFRVDWRSWINADKIATTFIAIRIAVKRFFRVDRKHPVGRHLKPNSQLSRNRVSTFSN